MYCLNLVTTVLNLCRHFYVSFQELDVYKSTTKEELTQWLNLLRQSGISSDWIIILVKIFFTLAIYECLQ
jgi:hypothetical protein